MLIVSVLIVSVLIVSVLKGGRGRAGDLSGQKRRGRRQFLFFGATHNFLIAKR